VVDVDIDGKCVEMNIRHVGSENDVFVLFQDLFIFGGCKD
jgi:hypothetical protein